MDQTEEMQEPTDQVAALNEAPPTATPRRSSVATAVPSQADGGAPDDEGGPEAGPVAAEAMAPPAYVYALGRVEPRFPNAAVEKELAQATGRAETAGLTDPQALHEVLSQRQNRYLARELCWVLTIEGLETYILHPHDPVDLEMLVEAARPAPGPGDMDIVIGQRGPIAPPEMCNGLQIPIIIFDQMFSFDRAALIKAIPRPEGVAARQETRFRAAAEELFDRIMQMADNAGATDEHRALNYLAVRYDAIYATATEAHERNFAFTGVEAHTSRLNGVRNIVDVVFSYTHRETDVTEKYMVRVDVSEEFPFLVTRLQPFFDR